MTSDSQVSKPSSPAQRAAEEAFAQPKPRLSEYAEEQQALDVNRERLKQERLAREAGRHTVVVPTPELPDDTPLADVRLSTRIQNALKAAGFSTVGEVREASDATLLTLQDLGKKSVSDLRATLGLPSSDGVRPR
ncbi:hypothetical protein H8B02_17420 [Bradyrhizobium sp. Pear77]|uniref:DNA-directed RNA polymerase subunit alpha C-terminal domain-containing protein n=1 Tax=Bradyrhizobium altum TaxID=1571202 RepID=UPI001E61803C|nr:DNA-directed RNA polymerase subunit alpha C-terminal domain-containing protein [Bradyrhizobium altum]MCC8955159.1 hypothetical protein [Bradyrhizobium altum]